MKINYCIILLCFHLKITAGVYKHMFFYEQNHMNDIYKSICFYLENVLKCLIYENKLLYHITLF